MANTGSDIFCRHIATAPTLEARGTSIQVQWQRGGHEAAHPASGARKLAARPLYLPSEHDKSAAPHLIWRTMALSRLWAASHAKTPWSAMSFQMAPWPPGFIIGARAPASGHRPDAAPTTGTIGCRNNLQAGGAVIAGGHTTRPRHALAPPPPQRRPLGLTPVGHPPLPSELSQEKQQCAEGAGMGCACNIDAVQLKTWNANSGT